MVVPLVLACAAGCLPLFYAYPTFSYVPELGLDSDHKDIAAFRVSITDDSTLPGRYRLAQLPIAGNGRVWGQGQSGINTGFGDKQVSHTLQVRLYRRGYRLIDIHAWQGESIQWTEADGSRARERAIDGLLTPTEAGLHAARKNDPLGHLEPGSVSPQHRQALLFAAGEYEYLASRMDALGEDPGGACDRCLAKAKAVRELADR
jgi:hypothetical protein